MKMKRRYEVGLEKLQFASSQVNNCTCSSDHLNSTNNHFSKFLEVHVLHISFAYIEENYQVFVEIYN